MPLLIPIQDNALDDDGNPVIFTSRFVALLSVDLTLRLEAGPVLLSADIASGEGTIVFTDVISAVLDAAR